MDPAGDRRSDQRTALRRSRAQPRYFARARRWLKPPRILRPTRAGWIFFLLTFGVGFAALNTGNNLLYLVLALMLSFLVLSGVLSESALRGIRVRRRLPAEIFAERPTPVALEIHNEQKRVAADKKRNFYEEYQAVMDLPAEFYLDTLKVVFQDHALPKGEMVARWHPVLPEKITRTGSPCG